jgi:flotillin
MEVYMGYGTESSLFGIVAAVLGIVLILTVVLRMWKKVPQDKAGVVTGMKKRVITGGGGLVIPVFERIDYISLGNIPLSVATRSSLSSQGVPISVITTAVIKVRNEKNSILTAIEQFTGRNEKEIIDNIQGTAIAVLEGKLREIIATMTVEELYQKREEFSSRVQEVVGTELGNMGLEVKNFTITDISDENGYIKALGDGMIAQRKKDAEIQKAEAARDMQIKTSQGESAKLKAEADIAQAAKDKAVLEANYMQEQQTAQAKAELAHDIQSNITQKDVIQAQMDAELLKQQRQKEIAEAQIQVQIASEQKNIELAQKQAERTKESLRVTIVEPANAEKAKQMADADAEKYRQIAQAQARAESKKVEAQAEAEADAIAKTGIAEAEATKAKGIAEAEAMEKKAEAYEKYGQAAMMEMLVKVLPQMAEQVAKPLQSIDKVTIIDSTDSSNGSGVGQMGGYVPSVLAKTIESIKETTGFDITDVMKANTIQAKTDRNISVDGVDGVSNITINNDKSELSN